MAETRAALDQLTAQYDEATAALAEREELDVTKASLLGLSSPA